MLCIRMFAAGLGAERARLKRVVLELGNCRPLLM